MAGGPPADPAVIIRLPRPDTAVVEGDRQALSSWRESMRRAVPGARYTPAYKRGTWDGYVRPGRLFPLNEGRCRLVVGRGLLGAVLDAFPQATLHDGLAVPDLARVDISLLRDYQRTAWERVRSCRWGRVALATNAGKGAIIAKLAESAVSAGLSAIVLTDEISVFDALRGELQKWAPTMPLRLVESGCGAPPVVGGTVLAMVPTLHARLRDAGWRHWLAGFSMALCDEADRAVSRRWQEVMRGLVNTHYRVGFSGTFLDRDDAATLRLEEYLGPILTRVGNRELVELGVSARPRIELWPYPQQLVAPPADEWFAMTGPRRRAMVYEIGIVNNVDRHRFIASLIAGRGPCAVIVNHVRHGRLLHEALPDSRLIIGSCSKAERVAVLEDYRRGKFTTLIATKLLDRGTNLLATTRCLVFASGEGSDVQTLQRIGRGLRRVPGKRELLLIDIVDVPRAGTTHAGRVDPYKYFRTAIRKRLATYDESGFEVVHVDTEV